MPSINYRIALEGGQQVKQELLSIEQAVKKLQSTAKTGAGADTFASTTAAISTLGSTAKEALGAAAAAAQKFGASGSELARVEGVINALGARARLSSTSFAILAQNYDKARASAGGLGTAVANAGSGFVKAEVAAKGLNTALGLTRTQLGMLAQVANVAGAGGFGRLVTAMGSASIGFGTLGAAFAGVAVAGGAAGVALVEFAAAAAETYKALSQLQQVTGQSFENLSALANAFGRGGTNVKQFAAEFGNLQEKIAAAGTQRAIRNADQDTVKWANDIDNVRGRFDQLAKGMTATFSPLTTLDTKVKALLESLSKEKTSEEQWFKLADIFRSLGSDLERAQLGKALGLSPETIASLAQGSAALKKMAEDAAALGITLDDVVDKENLSEMIRSQHEASGLFDALKTKIGALVAPAITSFWQGFTAQLKALIPVFTQIAAAIGQMDFTAIGAAAANFIALLAKIAAGWVAVFSGNVSFTEVLTELLKQAGEALVSLATTIGVALGQAIVGGMWDAVRRAFGGNVPLPGTAPIGGPGGGIGGHARGGLLGGRGSGTSDSNLAWLSRGEYIMPARAVRQPGVLAHLEALRRSGGIPRFAEGGLAGGTGSIIGSIIDGIVQTVNQIREVMVQTDAAMAGIQRSIIDQLRTLSRVAGGVRDITRNARGGLLGGRGTGTSDSNLAWVSRGEHIMPARAVRQPGVLAFLEALRHSGGDLNRLLDGMGRFALGGMVGHPMAIPAFASGGLASRNLGTLTLALPDGSLVSGLTDAKIADALRRTAGLGQVRSGGRKPSRYS